MKKAVKAFLAAALSAAIIYGGDRISAAEKGFSSMVDSFGSSVKSGFSKVSNSVKPKPKPSNISDATSLLVKAKPSAKLYVAVAQTYIAGGSLQEAEGMYQQALQIEPDHAEALVGLAQIKDQQNSYGEAAVLYEKAAKAHPSDAAVFNAMGLCHATHGNHKPALAALERAVQLQPRELRYRNNIAMILVEVGRYDEAYAHFKTLYADPQAHYNLAYLLQKRGDKQEALKHFAAALRQNPQFEEARTWYNHLAGEFSASYPAQQPLQPQYQPSMQQVSTPPPQVAQNAMQRMMPAPQQQTYVQQQQQTIAQPPQQTQAATFPFQRQPVSVDQTMPPQQTAQLQTARRQMPQRQVVQNEALAKSQFEALGPPAPPVPAAADPPEPRFGYSEVVSVAQNPSAVANPALQQQGPAQQPSPQLLPPIEQSFESLPSKHASPSGTIEATAPQAPIAPLPGSTMPTAPPTSGATRAPLVYPLPPVNEDNQ